MRRPLLLLVAGLVAAPAAFSLLVAGCGSTVVLEDPEQLDGGTGGRNDSGGSGGFKPEAGKDAFDEYVDPGCPDATPIPPSFDCDPYTQNCAAGEGCYIFVHYPSEKCGQEEYGSICAPAGWGQQGDACQGGLDCAAGLVCVVTGSGTQCVELCPLSGNDNCPSGFVCEPIDVEGFGGCL